MKESKNLRGAGPVPLVVRSRRFPGNSQLDRMVERRLGSTTKRFGDRIRGIVVYLDDVNGTRGGVDKACRVELALKKGDTIHAHGLGPTPEAAVAAAAPRAHALLVRSLGRSRARRTRTKY